MATGTIFEVCQWKVEMLGPDRSPSSLTVFTARPTALGVAPWIIRRTNLAIQGLNFSLGSGLWIARGGPSVGGLRMKITLRRNVRDTTML